MNSAKVIETERLSLEMGQLHDTDFIFKLLNSPTWIQFIGDRGIRTEDDARAYIENNLIRSYQENGFGLYKMVLKESRIPIGLCGFIKRDYLDHADFGFAILPAYENQGYTYEAAKAILEYGTTTLKLNPILAITTPENSKSRYLLEKIGFTEQASIRPGNAKREFLLFSK